MYVISWKQAGRPWLEGLRRYDTRLEAEAQVKRFMDLPTPRGGIDNEYRVDKKGQ